MAGYIGAKVGTVTANAADIKGDISATDTTPEITLKNTTETDADGSRGGKITFKGEQSGGEESTLANIQASHDGTADDEKGDLIFRTNDGSDGASPTERVRIDSNGSILTATLGTDNVHLGEGASGSIASGGTNNVTVGKDAGAAISTGDLNVAVGSNALKTISTHSNNTAIGAYALDAGTGNSNVAVGSGALGNASYAADNNIGIGKDALNGNTTGDSNVAVGHEALLTNSTAGNNTAVGYQAGRTTATGDSNTFVGQQAGYSSVGNRNTFVGRFAGNASNLAATQQNTFVGCFSGRYVTSGAKNTILGAYDGNQGGLDIRTASNNVVLSDGDGNVGFRITSGQTNVFAGSTSTSGSFSSSTARAYIVGGGTSNYFWHTSADGNSNFYVQRTTATGTGNLLYFGYNNSNVGSITCTTSNTAYNTSSDYRLKENVVDFTGGIERVKQLQPKRFSWIVDELDSADTDGFLAHEVSDVVPEAVTGEKDAMTTDPDGNEIINTQQIDHSKLVPLLTAALQEAIAKIETLETKVAALEAE